MSRGYTEEQIEEAAETDLYEFLMANFDDDFIREGREIHMRDHHALTIKQGESWFHDFSSGKTGNGINLLRDYYGYSFRDAVAALLGSELRVVKKEYDPMKPRDITLPERWRGAPDIVVKYLHEVRGIPMDTIQMLLDKDLIYQDRAGNLVFVNYQKTCFQVRSTILAQPPYPLFEKQKIISSGRVLADKFWYYMAGDGGDTAYICEGAIDAISLYELNQRKPGLYVSLGGASNQQIIDRIVADGRFRALLCVDNDKAGKDCRDRNPNLEYMNPSIFFGDWNEMLQMGASLEQHEVHDRLQT